MLFKSKWIVCGKSLLEEHWTILGSIEHQSSQDALTLRIAEKYPNHEIYGIWVINEKTIIRSSFAPQNEVIPVSRLFKSTNFIRSYADIVDGMLFIKSTKQKNQTPLRILATKEGFCLVIREDQHPFAIHWKKLISNFQLYSKKE